MAVDDDGYAAPKLSANGYAVPQVATLSRPKSLIAEGMDIESVCAWVQSMTEKQVDSADLHNSLKDGVTLCMLMNKLKPGSVRKVEFKKKSKFVPRSYIILVFMEVFVLLCL